MRRHFFWIESTNTAALEWGGAPPGSCVTADTQTSGRGRRGRAWSSPPGCGLYASFLDPPLPSRGASLWAALAAAEAVEAALAARGVGVEVVGCKWPNDVLLDGFKIGGVLCEARAGRLVVGVGLNLGHGVDDLPARPVFPASSLALLRGVAPDAEEMLTLVQEAFERAARRGAERCLELYRARWRGKGDLVRVGSIIGLAREIEADGALVLSTSTGLQRVHGGEAVAI